MLNETVRVLIVEDNADAARMTAHVLTHRQDAKFIPSIAGMAKEALNLIEQSIQQGEPFDILLLDINLPCIAGSDTVNLFQRRHPEIPIVALSAVNNPDVLSRCLEAGAQEFIDKLRAAENPEELTAAILRAMRRHRVRKVFEPLQASLTAAMKTVKGMLEAIDEDTPLKNAK